MKCQAVEDDYIFGKDILNTFKYVFPFIGLLISSIGLVFLLLSIPDSLGPGIASAAIFVAIGMIFILLSYKFSNLAATLYSLSEDTADNYGKTTISVNAKLPLFVSLLPLSFNIKGGRVAYLPVYLVSNTSIPYIPRYDTSALGLAKKAMDLGMVVLPVNRKTPAWIQQATSITPPEYPKIAYVQK